MGIEQIVNDLKSQGLENEQIIDSLEQMVQEGKITPEDLEKAKQMLMGEQTPEKEKAEAGKVFGLDLM